MPEHYTLVRRWR